LNENRTLKALIVCHAGAGVGLGHLTRALVVALSLQQQLGAKVRLLIQGDVVSMDAEDRFDYQFLPSHESLTNVVAALALQDDLQLLVFDLHPKHVPADIDDLFQELRRNGRKLIAVDALADHSKFLDLVFIPAFQFQPPLHEVGSAKFVFGWDCFLLNVRQTPCPWQSGKKVLALAGGSDATELGLSWPQELNDELAEGSDLHWVTGPFAQAPVWPECPRIKMHNHIAPSGLDDLMVTANYAVTVYGVSFYELLYYGVPTVVFSPYGSKDSSELKAIAATGIALVATDEHDAIVKLMELMVDDQLAATLSRKSTRQMSVQGGHKFASSVAGLIG
jgi:spore coat polysaccharide biosynthesis predicted glycosyltransferase SpsG